MEESKIKSEVKLLKLMQQKVPKALDHYFECQENLPDDLDLTCAKKLIKETFQLEIDLLLSNPEHYFKTHYKK